jgi:cytochrome c oxidase subunit 2
MWNGHHPGADGRFGETSPALVSPTNPIGLDRTSAFGRDDLMLPGEFHVPLGRRVVIEISSKDVVHSFGVPAMRVKQDATPGVRSRVSFTPTLAGRFEVACSQVCGLGHHRMRGLIVVESEDEYRNHLASEAALQGVK